jgi:hypothetical protein
MERSFEEVGGAILYRIVPILIVFLGPQDACFVRGLCAIEFELPTTFSDPGAFFRMLTVRYVCPGMYP